jgi:hypothetical protein
MSNLSKFNNIPNINLLWDVLLDELCINTSNKTLVTNIKTVFESNIKLFTARCNPKTHIMELNKQFLSQVVFAVNRLFPNLNKQNQEQNIKKINITNEESSEPYKIEDIHLSRQTEFEKGVERKRMELENYMTPQKPKELDFSYGDLDGKITEMDSLISEKMVQRNLDIEQLYNSSNIDPETWLKPKETSVKTEKINRLQNKLTNTNTNDKDLKKKVSFADFSSNNAISNNAISNNDINDPSLINIFQKLKRQPVIKETDLDIKEIIFEEEKPVLEKRGYAEQNSQPLSEIKQDQIKQDQINRGAIIQQQIVPIVPKNEVIKQLNEMNTKIDNLYEMIFKLTNSINELVLNKPNNDTINNANINSNANTDSNANDESNI